MLQPPASHRRGKKRKVPISSAQRGTCSFYYLPLFSPSASFGIPSRAARNENSADKRGGNATQCDPPVRRAAKEPLNKRPLSKRDPFAIAILPGKIVMIIECDQGCDFTPKKRRRLAHDISREGRMFSSQLIFRPCF